MEEYQPPLEGRSQGYLLLDFNERTMPPPRRIRKLLLDYAERGDLNPYPEYGELDHIIANYAGARVGQVIFTNGSDQGIDIIFRGVVERGYKVIIPSPSFAMHYQSAGLQGAQIVRPRFKGEDLSFPLEEVLDTIDRDTSLVVVSTVNNPTGTVLPKEDAERISNRAKEFETAVLIDEAYHEFKPNLTSKDLIDSHNNVFVTRSLSKVLGIASLRPGYVLSQEENILQLRKIRGPYDVNMAAVAVAKGLKYKDTVSEMMRYIGEVMEEAKPKIEDFLRGLGMKIYQSGANFVLVDPTPLSTAGIYNFLKSYEVRGGRGELVYKGILVRPRSDPPNTFRLTIGTNKEMDLFMNALETFPRNV